MQTPDRSRVFSVLANKPVGSTDLKTITANNNTPAVLDEAEYVILRDYVSSSNNKLLIEACFEASDPVIASRAYHALRRLPETDLIDFASRLFNDDRSTYKLMAISVFEQDCSKEAIAKLTGIIEQFDEIDVVNAAIESLGYTRDLSVTDLLEKISKSDDIRKDSQGFTMAALAQQALDNLKRP